MKFIARQKLRYDLGNSTLSIIQFAFIVLAASDKIAFWTGLPARMTVVPITVLAIVTVWSVGLFLDRAKFIEAYQSELNSRNEMLRSINDRTHNP